ncbi:MAG: hypothetical protein CMJ64_29735 [Planctomycetaceae bacterium]|nr:hypothetical protein [Planctomycetaceae bacterium]
MKQVARFACGLLLLSIPSLFAQEPQAAGNPGQFDPFLRDVAPEGRPSDTRNGLDGYNTPQQLVFRKAALKAAQRQQRIAMNKWLGYSPLRPPSSTVPFMGSPTRRPIVVRAQPVFLRTLYR